MKRGDRYTTNPAEAGFVRQMPFRELWLFMPEAEGVRDLVAPFLP